MKMLSVSLPDDLAEMIAAKVASGEFANESEVAVEAFRSLFTDDPDENKWVRDELLPAYDAYKANPSGGMTVGEARSMLNAKSLESRKAG